VHLPVVTDYQLDRRAPSSPHRVAGLPATRDSASVGRTRIDDREARIRILVCGINYAPDLLGIAKYTAELCEALAVRGHEVRVTTAPPYYPSWQVQQPYKAWRYQRETRRGVKLHRVPIYVPNKPSGLRRVLHHASFAMTSSAPTLTSALRWRPQVVFAVAPSLMSAPTAAIAARLAGARSWLHIQDFEVDAAFDLGLLRGIGLQRMLLAGERSILGMFDRVSTISPEMCRRLVRKGVSADKVEEIRNWVDTSSVVPGNRMTSYRRQLGIDASKIVALYSGNMAAKQGLEHLGDAAMWLAGHRDDIMVVLCGSGPMRGPLQTAIGGLPNVRFIDLQPASRLSELLSTADIHLLPQKAAAAGLVLPSKMSGMLASGRPIVAMAEPGTDLYLEASNVGIVTPPGSGEAFGLAVASLADRPALRTQLGNAARQAALKRWDKGAIIDQIEQKLMALAGSAQRGRQDAEVDASPTEGHPRAQYHAAKRGEFGA